MPQVRQVDVADREAGITALRRRTKQLNHAADDLIRCQHNRVLPQGDKLWERLAKAAPLGAVRFELPAGRGRNARAVKQSLHVHLEVEGSVRAADGETLRRLAIAGWG